MVKKTRKIAENNLPILAPSILSANFANLASEVKEIEKALNSAQHIRTWIHWDVMDGHFVPNLTFGSLVVKALRKETSLYFDCHLMVKNPETWIENFAKAGAQNITIHSEATIHLDRCVQLIKENRCHAGVSVNPATPISAIEPILSELDLVLVMSVNPGFGGQSYIEYVTDKIKNLAQIRREKKLSFKIQVDGGISEKNIAHLSKLGVDCFVAGTAVFGAKNRKKAIQGLFELMA